MKTKSHIASFLKTLKTVTPKRQLSFQKILEGIEDESLFGLAIIDIHTPEELKPEFPSYCEKRFSESRGYWRIYGKNRKRAKKFWSESLILV